MPSDSDIWKQLAKELKAQAGLLGFASIGIAPAIEPARYSIFLKWLSNNFAGEMHYLDSRKEAYRHPEKVMDGVQTLVMLTLPYSNRSSSSLSTGFGQVARYASGSVDYHDSIHHRLKKLGKWLEQKASDVIWRGVVDTAPLLEREFAELAGLGWIGKNTLLLNRQLGSYFFLASLLTNLPLPCDEPNQTDHCGTCRACLDACPTEAFPEPHVLDARRCISYLTIEQRGMPDRDLRSGIGNWLFGCDVCQQVCPWNSKSPSVIDPEFIFREEIGAMNLTDLLQMDDERFRNLFRHTPFWRTKRRGIVRNAAIVAGNQKALTCIPHLIQLLQDNEELIRAASVWALLQMPTPEATLHLQNLALTESHPLVLEELRFLPAMN